MISGKNPCYCDHDSNLLGRWKGQVTLEYRYATTRLHGFKKETNIIFCKNITLLWDVMPHNLIRKKQREVSSSHSHTAGHSYCLGCYNLSSCK